MKNEDLKKIYDAAYSRGEGKHYTRLLFSGGKLTEDKKAVLNLIKWKGKKVLDMGCGTGEMAYLIAKKKALSVHGVDFSSEAILAAKSKYQLSNLEYRVGDLKEIKGRYDVIVSMGTLEHTDDPFQILKSQKKLLTESGELVLTCPNWINPRGYILQTLAKLFDAKITLADLHYLTPVEFELWAKKLNMKLSWKTVDHDWAHGRKLVADLSRRIPNVLRDSNLLVSQTRIDEFVSWIDTHVVPFEKNTKHGGVTGVYSLTKKYGQST